MQQTMRLIASALAGSLVIVRPSCARSPSMRSLSTRFFGQPRLTNATERIGGWRLAIESGRKLTLRLVRSIGSSRIWLDKFGFS